MPTPPARVVLLGGASGSGKSRIAALSGLPILRLDDFYREGDDPLLPRLTSGEVDWDHPDSWHRDRALAALVELVHDGATTAPDYDISTSRAVGERAVALGAHTLVLAEGVFVAELIDELRSRGLLAEAFCVRRSRWVTMGLRLVRDLREGRKAPLFLVRRGLLLARREPAIVAGLIDAGFRASSVRGIRRAVRDDALHGVSAAPLRAAP